VTRYWLAATVLLMAIGLRSAPARAEDYPARTITMIVPFAVGGPADITGRIVADIFSRHLGRSVIVENINGAGGTIGAMRAARANPDGSTILFGHMSTNALAPAFYPDLKYDPQKDFEPVGLAAEYPELLVVRKDLPAKNLQEFVAYAKKNQEKMSYGSAGAGSATHLACVVLDAAMGTHITHIPYRGTGPAMSDLQAGRIDYLCEIITTAKPQIDGGAVKALALLTKTRSPALPNVPTAEEQGLQNAEAYTWNAIFLPKNAPEAIVTKLNGAVREAMHSPLVKERLAGLGAQIVADDRATPAYLGSFVKSEIEKWAVPIKASGAQAD
jgi:tripartite-type tricarboxylate transporter receptor subunit TctC